MVVQDAGPRYAREPRGGTVRAEVVRGDSGKTYTSTSFGDVEAGRDRHKDQFSGYRRAGGRVPT